MEKDYGALSFMRKFADGYRIVSTNDLNAIQIAESKGDGRLYVEPIDGRGWVAMPWHFSTQKDEEREAKLALERLTKPS